MSYTEKVSISGTALSFLLYECLNSTSSQEGFLLGEVTSEITNHISDSHSDNARLDTQIIVRTVLPLPLVSIFYLPTGRIKEDVLAEVLSSHASEVVGWYKYRKNNIIKPTFRDKLISKGLQKYFEKHHSKKNFVTCNLSTRLSSAGSTHTLVYRFGKINCYEMYEYIEDVTANLGEKHTGYKKGYRLSAHSIFHKIVRESNALCDDSSDAILNIQQAVDIRLVKEAEIAADTECTIRELEAEIRQMSDILSDKQTVDLQVAYDRMIEDKFKTQDSEMAQACVNALQTPLSMDILKENNILLSNDVKITINNHFPESPESAKAQSPSPILGSSNAVKPVIKPLVLNYAKALKKSDNATQSDKPSTSKQNDTEDLIIFDVEEREVHKRKVNHINDDKKYIGDSSPEY